MTQLSPSNQAGVAYFEQEWFVGQVDIFFSNSPAPVTQDVVMDHDFYVAMLAAAVSAGSPIVLPYGYVVGIDTGSGDAVAAVYNDAEFPLYGVVAAPLLNDAANDFYNGYDPANADGFGEDSDNYIKISVFTRGYFDIAGLTFPAGFTDAAHKLAANKYTLPGANILLGRKAYDGIIANPQPDLIVTPVGLDGTWNDAGVWTDSGAWTN